MSMTTTMQGKALAIGVASSEVLGPNPQRIGLILTGTGGGVRQTYSFGVAAVLDAGLTLRSDADTVTLWRDDIGDAICQPVFAINSAGAVTAGAVEVVAEG